MKFKASFHHSDLITFFFISLIAVFSGLIAAQGSNFLVTILLGLLLSPIVLFISTNSILAWALAFGFVFSGLIQYFGKINQIHWLVAGLFLAMYIRAIFQLISQRDQEKQQFLSITSICLIGYCAMAIISAAINFSPLIQAFVGLKHYIFPFGLTATILYSKVSLDYLLKLWLWIPKLLIIQLPIVLYQYLFIAKRRAVEYSSQGISWDALVGTFGGNQDGGGASGALALFLCFGIVATLAMRREKLISNQLSWIAVLSALFVIAIAEVKVVIVFLPVAILAFRRNTVFRSLPTFVGWATGSVIFIVGILLLYSTTHWTGTGLHLDSIEKIFEYIFKAEADSEFRNRLTGELSRSAALLMWWKENVVSYDIFHTIFGHGPAASKISASFGFGEIAKKYPFQLNTSALSAMLWDIGVVSVIFLLLALSSAAFFSFETAKKIKQLNPGLSAVYEGCGAGAILLIIDLPYNQDVINNPGIQMLYASIFGIVLAKNKLLNQSANKKISLYTNNVLKT